MTTIDSFKSCDRFLNLKNLWIALNCKVITHWADNITNNFHQALNLHQRLITRAISYFSSRNYHFISVDFNSSSNVGVFDLWLLFKVLVKRGSLRNSSLVAKGFPAKNDMKITGIFIATAVCRCSRNRCS